jgi:NAD-dependent dihydropyrimidine dehydrogenase PreA subunit
MTYVITEPCIGTKDQSCVEVCPVDCIYDAGDQFLINPEECIDCGACEPECPVEAAQTLTRESVEAYMDFMDSMFSWWQGGIQTAERGAKETEKATKGQKS